MTRHTLSVLVENKPGVLVRIAGLFARRGFNIDSLAVGPTEHGEISRITIVVNCEEHPLEQVTKQLNKLINVLKIVELEEKQAVQRELLLVKVRADDTTRRDVLQIVELFKARVADVVVHSTTKYLGGHSDVVGGAIVLKDPEHADELAFTQNATGAVAGPFDAWLTLRGVKTLAARMDRHCANAARVARALGDHPAVASVLYPGLPGHPGHEVAKAQMRDFGGMVSFRLAAGEEKAVDVCARTTLFTLGESLGGVESLIEHPARMTHASVAGSPLEVPPDLVRLSVGIEDPDDLLADLAQAID